MAMGIISSSHSERRPQRQSAFFRGAIIVSVVLLTGVIFTIIDLVPRLSHVNLTILSGQKSGQYFNLIADLAAYAKKQGGSVTNVSTTGPAENIKRLTQAGGSENPLFALTPDGVQFPKTGKLELVARLPQSETVFF